MSALRTTRSRPVLHRRAGSAGGNDRRQQLGEGRGSVLGSDCSWSTARFPRDVHRHRQTVIPTEHAVADGGAELGGDVALCSIVR